MNQEVENYIILLFGVISKPIPTVWHVQKEMFILSKVNPKIQQFFNFEKHYEGPYSQVLQDLIKEPIYFEEAYAFSSDGFYLTQYGKRIFEELKNQYRGNDRFEQLLTAMKLTRTMYDRLSKDELLFLIYITYPEYIELSNIYDRLVNDKDKKRHLAQSLLRKEMITKKRYEELVSDNFVRKV